METNTDANQKPNNTSSFAIPTQSTRFNALILTGKEKVSYESISYDFDNLPAEHIVIKVQASGLGPYDLGFVTGRLTPKNYGITFGVEGMGIVIKVGKEGNSHLLGRRVGFLSSVFDDANLRAYSEYAVTTCDHVVILPDAIDDYQGAYLLGNPATALALFDSVIKSHTSVLQDTASSALGKMVTKLCVKNGIKIINVVRREENVKVLNEIGSHMTLNSTHRDFNKDLKTAISTLNPSLYLTFQGGDFPASIIDKMPNDSFTCSCGNINNQLMSGFSSTDFIFQNKTIIGFQLFNYLRDVDELKRKELYKNLLEMLEGGDKTLYTSITKVFRLDEWEEARQFYESNMSAGKVILK